MASIVLRTVGAAVGNSILPGIGGAFLGALGRGAGAFIDGSIGLGARIQGPRLENLGVQDSRYGAGIPIIYGNARVAGNVIWATDLIETQHEEHVGGGKGGIGGGASVARYTYSVHCAVGICAGEIGSISTIWADSKVVYQDGVWASGVVGSATIYTGGMTQGVDAFMESVLGAGNAPAYRGLAYIVLESLQLSNFGNRLPNLTFEVLPVPASAGPQWLGDVDAEILQRLQVAQDRGMPPITLSGGSAARVMLVGGYQSPGSDCVFMTVEYDVTDTTPVEIARTQSGTFSTTSPGDHSWAMAPDGRYIAFYLEDASAPTHKFAIYDSVAREFGDILEINSGTDSVNNQLAWIDSQHFVIYDVQSGSCGLRVLARAGLGVIDLGFFDVWGSSSSSTRQPLYYAQFTPLAGGLIHYLTDISGLSFSAIYARAIAWQNNDLIVGPAYTLASGLSPGDGAGAHANLTRTGQNEWTLCYADVNQFSLMSFEPGATSAAITRNWQQFIPLFGTGITSQPVFHGDRLVFIQRGEFDSVYRLSEVTLNESDFSRVLDAVDVTGGVATTFYFTAARIDSSRLLLAGVHSLIGNMGQLGIIRRCDTGNSLSAIVTDILSRAGYTEDDYDVSALASTTVDGYVLQEPTSARAAIQPLQALQPFDLVESNDQLKAVLRGGAAAIEIPASERRAGPYGKEPPPPREVTRAQELDLPVEVNVDYLDAARDFEINSQRARRVATQAQAIHKIALPVVCPAATAKRIAETRLYTIWAERELIKLKFSRRYLTVEPGDVIDLDDGGLMRIASVYQAGGLIEAEGFFVYAAAGASAAAADTGQTAEHPGLAPVDSTLYLMDLPLLRAEDDQPGVYAAATGLPGWRGASIWRAGDGVNYTSIIGLTTPAKAGIAATTLPDGPPYYMDRAGTVNVQLVQGELASCSDGDLSNGANTALLGGEIIQFQTAALAGPGLYTLSNLLRGRRATESATGTHAAGENFILLTPGAVDFLPALLTDRGRVYQFRAPTNGQSLGDTQDNNFTYGLATLQPFAPAHMAGSRASGTGSDLTISWVRRARLNADWVDNIDVPLDEPEELYDLDIMNGSSVVRTFGSITSPTQVYTSAQQSTDWGGGIPATFTVKIYQISSRYGRGQAATATI